MQAFKANLKIVDSLKAVAEKVGCTSGQLCLAWVMAQGMIPIPGTKTLKYLEGEPSPAQGGWSGSHVVVENWAANSIKLTSEDLKAIRAVIDQAHIVGERYPSAMMDS